MLPSVYLLYTLTEVGKASMGTSNVISVCDIHSSSNDSDCVSSV